MSDPSPKRGAALGMVLLVLVALELLAHGVLLLARQEHAASRAGLRVLQARAAAEGAVSAAANLTLPDTLARVPLLGVVPLGALAAGPHQGESVLVRLDREGWLVEGRGKADGAGWWWRTARLAWVMDPVARGAAGTALVTPDPVLPPPGTVTAAPFREATAPAWCAPWAAALDSLLPAAPGPAVARPSGPAGLHLGRLDMAALSAALRPGPVGTGTPAPSAADGVCAPDPWNWGDPGDAPGACGDRLVAAFHPGDVLLEGGVGQGVVAVRGDLTLRGTRLRGLVLVEGDLVLGGGATVDGQVRVSGAVRLDGDARIRHAPCDVARALTSAAPLLRLLLFPPEVGWLEG